MNESRAVDTETATSAESEPGTIRLVIRAEIIPPAPASASPSESNSRLPALLIGAAILLIVAIGLGWATLSDRSSSTSGQATDMRESQQRSANAWSPAPPPGSASPTQSAQSGSSANPTQATPIQPPEANAATTALNEVVPNASQNALQTIRGTVRVAIRVTIDREGTVIAATAQERGPSRYFERISLEAARKWTFNRASTSAPRSAILKFQFTRYGATAGMESEN